MAAARVYCSGPLFNEKEREEMQEIAAALEKAGFETFLPHRDGFEFTPLLPVLTEMGMAHDDAHALWDRAIFALDVYQVVLACDALAVNLNGRVPDEGAVSEAAIAWASGKVVVGVKTDLRSLYWGRDNPLVVGLFGFRVCSGIGFVADAISEGLAGGAAPGGAVRPRQVGEVLALGGRLWDAKTKSGDLHKVAEILTEPPPKQPAA